MGRHCTSAKWYSYQCEQNSRDARDDRDGHDDRGYHGDRYAGRGVVLDENRNQTYIQIF